ncbi:hypothetical protein PHMEG_0005376 [Phytophthora megakarya]|uniref:Reverse transcriptase n=1 Tax=Phytophthora megakarya TaxID=4795 RepID=A0A225WT35_9STRA|nr:hypothetical protein PHMEG_0005376 [Phytophthora megakarya]
MLTLKTTNEWFKLGSTRMEESHILQISLTMRLRPGGQTIVVTDIIGNVPDVAIVLAEGSAELDATVMVARALVRFRVGNFSLRRAPKEGPTMSLEMLEADYQGYVLSFDGAAKVSTRRGSCGCILWKLPGWQVVKAEGHILEGVTVNDAQLLP